MGFGEGGGGYFYFSAGKLIKNHFDCGRADKLTDMWVGDGFLSFHNSLSFIE